jgi:phenylacetate-CoA ligase
VIGTALAQLNVAGSVAFGLPPARWALDHLVAAALATQREFGAIGSDAAELVSGPALDEGTRRDMQTRRFRSQACHAARETVYYSRVFGELGLDPQRLTSADITRLPCTTNTALRTRPEDFVSRRRRPALVAHSSGTTGQPVNVAFSQRELAMFASLSALGFLLSGELRANDVVYLAGGSGIAAHTLQRACERLGAVCVPGGGSAAEATLRRLSQSPNPTVLHATPSFLGALVEAGLRSGYRAHDFRLERILTGGEILTTGLHTRANVVFGNVQLIESYGLTETFGVGGQMCADGHMHFHSAHGMVEVVDPETSEPVPSGGSGTLVVTPLPPFRETTLLLRYDTQDLVQVLTEPPTCALRGLPAVGRVLGKKSLCVRHAHGWTWTRDVLEALEGLDDVPLPARCGMWLDGSGVAIEVLVRAATQATRQRVGDALEQRGVPVCALDLVTDREQLRRPPPVRWSN